MPGLSFTHTRIDVLSSPVRFYRLVPYDYKTGIVVRGILNAFRQNIQVIGLRGKTAGNGCRIGFFGGAPSGFRSTADFNQLRVRQVGA